MINTEIHKTSLVVLAEPFHSVHNDVVSSQAFSAYFITG